MPLSYVTTYKRSVQDIIIKPTVIYIMFDYKSSKTYGDSNHVSLLIQ